MSTNTVDTHGRGYGEWNSMSKMYGRAVTNRLTFPIVSELVEWVDNLVSLKDASVKALDNGCGTGALCSALKRHNPDIHVLATDYSPGMIDKVQALSQNNSWINFEARVLDARELNSIESNSITHVLSSFMICLAPDPNRIAGEMLRVLQPGGVLGLAVWGDPQFGYWEQPWIKACRELDPEHGPVNLMDLEWTYAENVERSLERVGFKNVKVRSTYQPWHWESVKPALEYFFDGQNPVIEKFHRSWTEKGWSIDDIKPIYKQKLEEAYGQNDGSLKGPVSVCLALAQK